jgi:predicted transcriptional regulator of viral defense system
MDSLVKKLYQSPKTILTVKDLSLIWQINKQASLYAKTAYYVKKKVLIRLTRGVFSKNKDYKPKELAANIYTPSYISFETVLRESGIIFQHYNTIFIAAPYSLTKKIDNLSFTFRKLKNEILFNPTAIINKDNYNIASPERAFLDMIYLFPNYYFDNLSLLNWQKCQEIIKIYNNKQMEKRLFNYIKNYDK